MIVILDFDGTLTAEEEQAAPLAERSLATLSREILDVPLSQLRADYAATRAQLLSAPHCYWWEVNGLVASYCDEGAFILNTTTLQVLLRDHLGYRQAVERRFAQAEYDPVVDCTNYLFHRHTAELTPRFRPGARETVEWLLHDPDYTPLILTNSLGDKVARHLQPLGLDAEPEILGDTRQYDMQPAWQPPVEQTPLDVFPLWRLSAHRSVDLRRPAYYAALARTLAHDGQVTVVADTFSLPGALALQMGIRFYLLATPYTPAWCAEAVRAHPLGAVLEGLADLPAALPR